jgi:hypothetical protein
MLGYTTLSLIRVGKTFRLVKLITLVRLIRLVRLFRLGRLVRLVRFVRKGYGLCESRLKCVAFN